MKLIQHSYLKNKHVIFLFTSLYLITITGMCYAEEMTCLNRKKEIEKLISEYELVFVKAFNLDCHRRVRQENSECDRLSLSFFSKVNIVNDHSKIWINSCYAPATSGFKPCINSCFWRHFWKYKAYMGMINNKASINIILTEQHYCRP